MQRWVTDGKCTWPGKFDAFLWPMIMRKERPSARLFMPEHAATKGGVITETVLPPPSFARALLFWTLDCPHLSLESPPPFPLSEVLETKGTFWRRKSHSCEPWSLIPLTLFCFQDPRVLPSGRLGADREICEWRCQFTNHPTGCLIKCKSRHGEKRRPLSFPLQIKCSRATHGDQEPHAEAASALSDSSPKNPASPFYKPASCSWRVQKETCFKGKKFLWHVRRDSKSPEK